MPLARIHLIALEDSQSLRDLLNYIKGQSVQPYVVSKPIRWVIRPEQIEVDQLLSPKWDLLLIVPSDPNKPNTLAEQKQWKFTAYWTATVGIPSRLTEDFSRTNRSLLHPAPSAVPTLTGALEDPLVQQSSQSLALSHELQNWIRSFSQTRAGKGAVSMLNLLAFKPGKKPDYLQYGKAFAETIGSKRGGNAKLVGNIVHADSSPASKWEEFALAHYPSILHFADMLASRDYQEVNQRFRVPSLEDTCILCTSELEMGDLVDRGAEKNNSKL